jgi:hypothetical protein
MKEYFIATTMSFKVWRGIEDGWARVFSGKKVVQFGGEVER